jgi:hypothetical protein
MHHPLHLYEEVIKLKSDIQELYNTLFTNAVI